MNTAYDWSLSIICTVEPACEATPFASEKWPFKRGGLSSGVEINTFMFRFSSSSGLSRGGGLSKGWPLKRGSTVVYLPLLVLRSLCVFVLCLEMF